MSLLDGYPVILIEFIGQSKKCSMKIQQKESYMSTEIQNTGHQKRSSIINDPGNMLIICYIAIVIFFLLIGGLGATKFSSIDVQKTSTVINEKQLSDSPTDRWN